MAKNKEEEKSEEKKVVKKKKPQEEKFPVIELIAEIGEDTGVVAGALNKKGMYLQFIDDLTNDNQKLLLSKDEFKKIIEDFKNGEL